MKNIQRNKKWRKANILLAAALLIFFVLIFSLNVKSFEASSSDILVWSSFDSISFDADSPTINSYGSGGIDLLGNYEGLINLTLGSITFDSLNASVNESSGNLSVSLLLPINGSKSLKTDLNLTFNISGNATLDYCTIYLDSTAIGSLNSPTFGVNSFIATSLANATHFWNVSCTDSDSNTFYSDTNKFEVVLASNFDNQSTDLSSVNISNVVNFTLSKSTAGKIIFSGATDLTNATDFDSHIKILDKSIIVDSLAMPYLDKPATLVVHNILFDNYVILRNGAVCSNCNVLSFLANTLTFSVLGFSNYTIVGSTKLSIFDDSVTESKFINSNVNFYANMTNFTSGETVLATCKISFDESGWSPYLSMIYNTTSKLHQYNRSFSSTGSKAYKINCTPSQAGFDELESTSFATVGAPQGGFAQLTLSNSKSSRRELNDSPMQHESVAGNLNPVELNSTSVTNGWQGYYGNISATIILSDQVGNNLYDWRATAFSGEIYASRSQSIDWQTIGCIDIGAISSENAFIGKSSSSPDSFENTYNSVSHPSFAVGSTPLNNCKSTRLHGVSGPDDNFWNIALGDNAGTGNVVYTSIVKQQVTGFLNETIDFQLMVAAKQTPATPYYFFLEIN